MMALCGSFRPSGDVGAPPQCEPVRAGATATCIAANAELERAALEMGGYALKYTTYAQMFFPRGEWNVFFRFSSSRRVHLQRR